VPPYPPHRIDLPAVWSEPSMSMDRKACSKDWLFNKAIPSKQALPTHKS